MVFSLLLFMLEDNRQPLVCAYKHDEEVIILSAENEKFTTAKIGISVAALATGSIATIILLIGELCSTISDLFRLLFLLA